MTNSWIAAWPSWRAIPNEVELGARERGHLLALHRPLDGPDLVAQDARAFVLRLVGGDGHLAPERPDDDLLATLEEQLDLLDVRAGSRPSRWPRCTGPGSA